MNSYPEEVLEIANKCAAAHPDSIQEATDEALEFIRGLPSYKTLVDTLVLSAVQHLIHDARHRNNTRIWRDGRPKVNVGSSRAVATVCEASYLDLTFGGKQLRSILGKELSALAANEEEMALGRTRNAKFLRLLARIVPDEKTVGEVVTETKAKKLAAQVAAEMGAAATATAV